jgi:arylsulfatase A-like enzyme
MLFDRATVAKSKPWSSASSVPLICSGPGVQRDAVSSHPVSTVDLAPTFLDLAGILDQAPPGMSRLSLVPVLTGANSTPARSVVQFGLGNFRGVIHRVNDTHVFKFFCCCSTRTATAATPGRVPKSDGRCPGATQEDMAGFAAGQDEHHLFNIAADRFESPASDIRKENPALVAYYASLLPPRHETASNNHSSHPKQGHGYTWAGCRFN